MKMAILDSFYMTKIFFKVYPRLKKKTLILDSKITKLRTTLHKRKSERNFKKVPVSIQELSQMLYYSAGIKKNKSIKSLNETRRMYPSAGARYPLEIYVVSLNVKDLAKGLYHFNVKDNFFEFLYGKNLKKKLEEEIILEKIPTNTSAIIFMTSVYERSTKKYGKKGIKFSYIEAGHIGQNIYLNCQDMGLSCFHYDGINEKNLLKLLDIEKTEEIYIMTTIIGKK